MPPKKSTGRVVIKNTGRANVQELIESGRLKGFENPFDPIPNAQSGHTLDPVTGMRIGLTPEGFLAMVDKDLENPDRKFSICRLTADEMAIIKKSKDITDEDKEKIAAQLKKCFNLIF